METIRLNVNSYVLDENSDTLDSQSCIITADYQIYGGIRRKSFPSVNSFVVINFDGITTANYVRVTSDQTITILIDGTKEQTGKSWIIQANVASLSIKNQSGVTANIEYEIAGS